jgi:hypothetical protein
MGNQDKIAAISMEARKRGVTYGELAASLEEDEKEKVYHAYMREKKRLEKARKREQ